MRDLYTRNTDRGRGGSKIPKIRLTSFVHGPLSVITNHPLPGMPGNMFLSKGQDTPGSQVRQSGTCVQLGSNLSALQVGGSSGFKKSLSSVAIPAACAVEESISYLLNVSNNTVFAKPCFLACRQCRRCRPRPQAQASCSCILQGPVLF